MSEDPYNSHVVSCPRKIKCHKTHMLQNLFPRTQIFTKRTHSVLMQKTKCRFIVDFSNELIVSKKYAK